MAKKQGGLDDGNLYALKAINITYLLLIEKYFKEDMVKIEREVRFH